MSVPPEVAELRSQSEYAPVEGVGDPYYETGLDVHDIEVVPTTRAQEKLEYPKPTKEELSSSQNVLHTMTSSFRSQFHTVPATDGRQ